jgi:hypothetical protein
VTTANHPGPSEDARALLHWAEAFRNTRIADYVNDYERGCARKWAAHIIAKAVGSAS